MKVMKWAEMKGMRVMKWAVKMALKKERCLVGLMVHYLVPTTEDLMAMTMVDSWVYSTADY